MMVWTLQKKTSTPSISNLVACRRSCVCYCCCCKCCCKCCKCCGSIVVSIQSSYTPPSNYKCSSPSRNLVSCSLLTSWFYSLKFFSCGDVIYGTSCLCSFSCFSYGDVIYGISTICLATCTIVCIAHTIVGTASGSIYPSSFFVPLNLCSLVPFSLLSLRLLLPQLCSSF